MSDMLRPYKNSKANTIVLFLIAIFTLFRGLRWETGTDWDSYLDLYSESSFSNIFSFDRYGNGSEMMEPGIVFFNAIFNSLFPYTIYLLASNAFILWAYKRTVTYFLPKRRVFAFCFLTLTVAFFPVRQEIANAIMMLSLPYLLNKEYKKYILLSFLAISIHKSALFIILLITVLKYIKLPSRILIAAFFSSLLIGVTIVQSLATSFAPVIIAMNAGFEHNLEYYTETISDEAGVSVISVLPTFILVIIGVIGRKSKNLKENEEYNLFINIMVVFFSLNLLFTSSGLTLLMRLTKLLFFGDAFVLAYFANSTPFFCNKLLRSKLTIFAISLIVGGLGINRFINKCQHYPELMFPYISVFSDSKRSAAPIDFDYHMLLK